MALRLVQVKDEGGARRVAQVADDGSAQLVTGVASTYDLVQRALDAGQGLEAALRDLGTDGAIDLGAALAAGRVLAPIDHPDAAHLHLTGTGLTHLGSAEGRDKMHKAAAAAEKPTDSMRMFQMGVEGGKPADGGVGVQPEWFYKGDGTALVAPGAPLTSPGFAEDGGEEPEIAGIYVIDADGNPVRLGFALANEFSDHVTEKQNYLWLAHSKLRPAAVGPELLVGPLPADVRGASRIKRGGDTVWEKPFLSGEANMSHHVANLEHHHFKYPQFRRPGDVHVHFFGTATLSFSDGFRTEPGDVFEIEAAPFTLKLSNPLAQADDAGPARVRAL
ncbi:AraD1 family protein [Mangrovibrevibacter kandeliae]|uniref:AraD1 family protein n=1 Tax=Mangrovibrevibacter kandeliae TaxID=2968473 RepID=UPI0021180CD2|nr:AraD1 family protein [Aurantimonas sp. CSK15Z-1]MCQ8783382.1 GguC family protein [Aurantimonas sp. CSK15Z-1]